MKGVVKTDDPSDAADVGKLAHEEVLIKLMDNAALDFPESLHEPDTVNRGTEKRLSMTSFDVYDTTAIYMDPFRLNAQTKDIALQQNEPPYMFPSEVTLTPIRDIRYNTKVTMQVIVVKLCSSYSTRQAYTVTTAIVADPSGSMEIAFWDDVALIVKEGDILLLTGVRVTVFNRRLQLKVGKDGSATRTGMFCMPFRMQPDYSVLTPEIEKLIKDQSKSKRESQASTDEEKDENPVVANAERKTNTTKTN